MNRYPDGNTILLVEDDPNDVLLVQRAFRRSELSSLLQVARDGDRAIDYLLGQGSYQDRQTYPLPFLIILDLKLPRRSGFEVLQWIRETSVIKRIPVIVFTSSAESDDVNQAYEAGANSYLVKPPTSERLSELINYFQRYWLELNQYPSISSF